MGRRKAIEPAVVYDPDSLTGQYEAWLRELSVRQFSPCSLITYRGHLQCFVEWAQARGLARPQEVTRPILVRYQHWLYQYRQKNGRALTVGVQASRLSTLKSWFSWLTRKGQLLYNPASDLDLPRKPQALPRQVLSAREAEAVLWQADGRSECTLRDRAMLEVLYSCGIRRQELIDLNLESIDAERGCLFIREGKGRRDRLVPISERALAWVVRYRDEVREGWLIDQSERALFLSIEGNRLSGVRLGQLVSGYIERADLGKRGSCHLLRHTMATLLLENGADIRHIQATLGHSKLTSTQLYTQVNVKQLRQVHERCHPGWRLTRGRGQDEVESE